MTKYIIVIGLIFLLTTNVKADGILISWGPNDLTGMTKERFDASKLWTTSEILNKVKTANNWPDIYLLLVASKQFKDDNAFIDSLINQITNISQSEIKLTSRLIIWERITSGDILFEGKGVQISDDLFKVAGRVNWILRNLTGKNFGPVKINFTSENLQLLKEKWINWRKGKNQDEYKNPYETATEGLDEIKSIEALEAIICSLKNSERKQNLTSDCLKNLYNLNELPTDPNSPAYFCNPDTYSYVYLANLTGIENKESFEWWTKWWLDNKDKLEWNKRKGMFIIKK